MSAFLLSRTLRTRYWLPLMFSICRAFTYYDTEYHNMVGKRSGLTPYFTHSNASRVFCATTCSTTPNCFGADYDQSTRQCHLLSSAATVTTQAAGWTYLCCDCPRFPVPRGKFTSATKCDTCTATSTLKESWTNMTADHVDPRTTLGETHSTWPSVASTEHA